MRPIGAPQQHPFFKVWRRARRLGLAAAVGWGLVAMAGCGQTEDAAGSTGDKGARPMTGGAGGATPAIAKGPPDLYLSSTSRFQRVARLPGRVELSPDGEFWLQDTGPELRVLTQDGAQTLWTTTTAALCAADGRPADAAVLAHLTADGWLWYRTAPAGSTTDPTGDFSPAAQPGEWKRFFPNTGRGKPIWDGFQVTALSPNLRFAIAAPAEAAQPAVVLDLQYAVTGGVLRSTPLPAEPGAGDPRTVRAIGDSGAILLMDGRMYSAGPASGKPERPAVRLKTLGGLPGLTPWDGAPWRICRTVECTAVSLTEPPATVTLPAGFGAAVHSDHRLVVESPQGLVAVDFRQPEVPEPLPVPVGAGVPALDRPEGGAGGGLVERHVTGLARASEDLLVVTETAGGGQSTAHVYRWERLR